MANKEAGMKTFSIMMAGMALALTMTGVGLAQDQAMTQGSTASGHGTYAVYSQSGFDAAKDLKRVLFFAASWCPTCMATDKALKQPGVDIPAGISIFKADFDSSTDLKAKYGVTSMDTFVEVDKDGQKVTLWNGGGVEGIAKNVK